MGDMIIRGHEIAPDAQLIGANLSEAHLSGANLSEANLSEAHLIGANLSEANLSWAQLIGANLSGANLSGANLIGANLSWAHLIGANLSEANLRGANLSEANLRGANLSGAAGIVCLPVGDPRGYRCVAVDTGGAWTIHAGCRAFSVPDARQHWGGDEYPDPAIGARYLSALDWLDNHGELSE